MDRVTPKGTGMDTLHKICAAAALASGLSLGCASAQASGGMSGCFIGDALGTTNTGLKKGTLDFGSPPNSFTGTLRANATSGGTVAGATQIVCSPEVEAMKVSVSGGDNAGQGDAIGIGSRAMKMGISYLPYEVYSDSSMTNVYPANAADLGMSLPGDGAAINLPVYGRIQKTSTRNMAEGSYADTLQVTLSW